MGGGGIGGWRVGMGGGINTPRLVFIAAEECSVPVGRIETRGQGVRVMSATPGPLWIHGNGVIGSLAV